MVQSAARVQGPHAVPIDAVVSPSWFRRRRQGVLAPASIPPA